MMSEEKVYDDWRVSSSKDDFTDEVKITASTATDSDGAIVGVECYQSWSGRKSFVCLPKIYISLSGAGSSWLKTGSIEVDSKVDDKKHISGISGELVTDSNDDRAVLIDGGKVAELIEQMSESEEGKKKMILRITYEEVVTILRYKVSLKGFKEAYEHLLRDCREYGNKKNR